MLIRLSSEPENQGEMEMAGRHGKEKAGMWEQRKQKSPSDVFFYLHYTHAQSTIMPRPLLTLNRSHDTFNAHPNGLTTTEMSLLGFPLIICDAASKPVYKSVSS